MSFPTSETRSLRSSSFMGEGLNRAAQLPLDGLQLGRSRSRTWTPQHRRSSGVFSNRRLDEWLFPIEDEEAYATWVSGPRQQWLQSVQRYGGFRGWLLEGLELRGMDDKNYLLGLRWLSGVALPHSAQAEWAQRKTIAEEIEKDVPRTFPGHPCEAALARSSRDILRMLCCARNVTVGYTQGLNFTAAMLSCTMGRDEAFWCLTALAESVAAHFVSGNMLQGAVADCECIDWLASQLEPKLFALCRSSEGYSSVIFARPLCTLLSCCGLPVDATLQCWRAILHSSNPRIFLLRTLAAFVLQTAARLLAASSGASLELPELMEALQKIFQQTYDAQVVLSAAAASVEILPDSTLSKKLEEIEQRLQQSAAESHQRRQMENQKLQEKRLKQLVLEDRSARQSLLREMQLLWRHERHRDVSQLDFLMLLAADHLDVIGVKSSTWEAFLSTVFVDLDSSHSGMVLLKHALIAVALLLGETPLERVSAIFSMLEIESLCLRDDFLELAEATGQENSASEWLVANGITENLNQNVFIKALLALPSLALATLSTLDSKPGNAGSFSISFTSSSGILLPVAPKWVPDEQQVACQLCSTSFTCCRRRHHCRACGRRTCRQCSGQRLALAIIGYPNPVRVCDECFFVLSPAV